MMALYFIDVEAEGRGFETRNSADHQLEAEEYLVRAKRQRMRLKKNEAMAMAMDMSAVWMLTKPKKALAGMV